jgi:ABC-2 type transport system permease protein
MRFLRLFKLFFRLGVLAQIEYRINFLLHCFEAAVQLASGLSVLWVIFSQTPTIAGWTWNELLVVMGLYFLGYGLVGLTIAPSIREFMFDVWKGNLDFLLIKPENHQFLASVRKVMFWNVVETLIGVVIVVVALVRLGADVGVERALLFMMALAAGGMLIYSFWICLATMSFWTTKMENIMLLYYHLYEAGRWPVAMYPGWLRYTLTFAVPIAFAVTMPAEALIGRLGWGVVSIGVTCGLISLAGSRSLFQIGIRRYTSASS